MSMSEQDKYWHDKYESLSAIERGIVDVTFNNTRDYLFTCGANGAMDDRAEQLIAAITRYMILSKGN